MNDDIKAVVKIFTIEGLFVGQGCVTEAGRIVDCDAHLGEDDEDAEKIREEIEEAISYGETWGITDSDPRYEWELTRED